MDWIAGLPMTAAGPQCWVRQGRGCRGGPPHLVRDDTGGSNGPRTPCPLARWPGRRWGCHWQGDQPACRLNLNAECCCSSMDDGPEERVDSDCMHRCQALHKCGEGKRSFEGAGGDGASVVPVPRGSSEPGLCSCGRASGLQIGQSCTERLGRASYIKTVY